ncbi:MAG: DJ-1/PfpI family protein [Ruminococcaceae bacterium]|nr:DJ-1/PfpI family protein [Oscillospiraceae bacterium]
MVYVLLADGFEEIEALTPVDLLRRAGVCVTTVGVTGKTVKGSHGIPVVADVDAQEALAMLDAGQAPEMVVFPGGMPGAKNLDESPLTDKFLAAVREADGYAAAICAAPMILGKRGLLQGIAAVCYPGFEEYLLGAKVQERCISVAWDSKKKIITGCAMGAATEFALTLVEALKGESTANELRAAILFE